MFLGGSHEGYCRWMCYAAYDNKWRSLVFNYRGCNGVPLGTPKGYSPAITDDVVFVIREIKRFVMTLHLISDGFIGGILKLLCSPLRTPLVVSCCASI